MTSTTPPTPTELFGDPQEFVIPRDGDRDLAFRGWRLSTADECKQWFDGDRQEHCVDVMIYLTKSKQIVTHVRRWTQEAKGDKLTDEEHKVAHHWQADDAVEWLKADGRGKLGGLSKKAWVEACQAWPDLKDQAVDWID